MKAKLLGLALFAAVFVAIGYSASAVAEKSQPDLYSIMETYQNKIAQAQSDFLATVKKINSDARDSVLDGILPIDQINANTKSAMQDARTLLKDTIQQAREDAKSSLLQLKATIDSPGNQV